MRSFLTLAFALAAFTAFAPSPSFAAPWPWFQGYFGGSTYAMGDVNDNIGQINATLAGSGLSMEEVTKGFNFGAAFGLDLGTGFSIGVGYDRLMGKSDVGDWSGSITYDLPANLYRALARYAFESGGNTQGFLEASGGGVTSAGGITLAITGAGSQTVHFDGSGAAFEVGGGVQTWVAPQVALLAAAGYRHASIGKITVDGQRIYDANGGDFALDYSGVFLRVGLTVGTRP